MGAPPLENKPPEKQEPVTKPSALADIVELFKTNIKDTVAYLLLTGSLLYCFFDPFFGGVCVGFIMGLYFSSHVFHVTMLFRDFLMTEGIFRGFIIISAIAALIISAPGLCLGLFLGTFIRPFFDKSKEENSIKGK